MLDLLIILCRYASYERTHMVLFHATVLLQSYMPVEFQHLLALLDVFNIACAVQICFEGKNFSKSLLFVLSLHPDPSIPLKLEVSQSERVLQKYSRLLLSALAHLKNNRTGAANVFLLTSFPLTHAPELYNRRTA